MYITLKYCTTKKGSVKHVYLVMVKRKKEKEKFRLADPSCRNEGFDRKHFSHLHHEKINRTKKFIKYCGPGQVLEKRGIKSDEPDVYCPLYQREQLTLRSMTKVG